MDHTKLVLLSSVSSPVVGLIGVTSLLGNIHDGEPRGLDVLTDSAIGLGASMLIILADRVAWSSNFSDVVELGVQGMNLCFVGGRLRYLMLLLSLQTDP